MNIIKRVLVKYKCFILYVFFGGCTTMVNIIAYVICARGLSFGTIVSNSVAWILAVTSAYLTNRVWVFNSKANQASEIIREVISFFSCRILTGLLDLLMMYVFVDIIGVNDLIMKLISNFVVIILNYVASKVLIFKNRCQHEERI